LSSPDFIQKEVSKYDGNEKLGRHPNHPDRSPNDASSGRSVSAWSSVGLGYPTGCLGNRFDEIFE